MLATDDVLFTIKEDEFLVRLIKVDRPPHFINMEGLPGGLIKPNETAENSAKRQIETKTGISTSKLHLEQLYTFSRIDRDRRGRVVAVAYLGLVPWDSLTEEERKGTKETWWAPVNKTKKLAYDHDEMLEMALQRLRSRVRYTTVLSKLMPKEFTLTELENAYETVLGTDLDKRNFRKKILKLKVVTEAAGRRTGGRFRPAQLYRFTSSKVDEIEIL